MPLAQSLHEARTQVEQLVDRFHRNLELYKRPSYKEARVRIEFIDPFFEALGWDVRNIRGCGEHDKDVIYEDAVRIGGKTGAPDYSFRIGQKRRIFLEAKRPGISLKGDVGPAYQLRRYSWSVKLALGLLTDFEEFAVYDCRQRPRPADKAAVGRIQYLTYDQYLEQLVYLYGTFSKEAVQAGALDSYAQETRPKRGTSEVDAELLKEIEGWRDALARNIALRNLALSVHELNFAVQRTIDRIIFLRMAEDRGIEPYGQLRAISRGPDIYPRLAGGLYLQADAKYNAGLFDFRADALTAALTIDDQVLRPILTGLYYPDCPYEFSVLPVEILGQVYEQFLGKVIRLTPAHRAKVEEKPEVKKAGGVYYTPSYIVEYIVRQTVGKLVEGKSPPQLRGVGVGAQPREGTGTVHAAPLRVLDPACGSGSFLLGAYQYLLDHYLRWYEAHDPETHARARQPAVYQGSGGQWRLTGAEKKRILLDHIYGVDIDRQAVEVTKLSLLLQVLEDESEETLGQQLSLLRERALPDLGDNIKCGNSLIGPDYFEGQLMPDPEEVRRVNPFDWQAEFPEAMAAGGFDAVIGNPPYIRIQTMKEWAPTEVEFYKSHYVAASKGNYDIYVVFVERGLQLLNRNGKLGYILPHKFFQAKYGEPLRGLIAEGQHLAEIVHFGDQQVFAGATTYTCLLFLDRVGKPAFRYAQAHDLEAWRSLGDAVVGEVAADKATGAEWNFVIGPGAGLFERLNAVPTKLGDLAHIFVGLQTSADPVFILAVRNVQGDHLAAESRSLGEEVPLECMLCKPLLKGSDIQRYQVPVTSQVVLFPYHTDRDSVRGWTERELRTRLPKTHNYLSRNRAALARRAGSSSEWFHYTYPKNLALFQHPKILTGVLARRASFSIDVEGGFCFVGGGNAGGYGIIVSPQNRLSFGYVLGLLNSRLLDFYLHRISTTFRGGFFSYARRFTEQLPIRTIDFEDPADVARHDQMVALVERMLDLHKKLSAATIPADKMLYQRQIEATDRQIDALVYELYGLTEEEIAIVEAAGS